MRALFRSASLLAVIVLGCSTLLWPSSVHAITAPELRGQFAVQEITMDMHGLDLKEKEFLKADLRDVSVFFFSTIPWTKFNDLSNMSLFITNCILSLL